LLKNNDKNEIKSSWTISCDTETSYNAEDELKTDSCEVSIPEIVRE
jgi:hypothetical protein